MAVIVLTFMLIGSFLFSSKEIVSPHKLFLALFGMVYLGWFVFVVSINFFVDYKQTYETINDTLYVVVVFLICYLVAYGGLSMFGSTVFSKKKAVVSIGTINASYKLFFWVGVLGLALYVAKNGVVLLKVSSSGYEQKNVANAGAGIARILYSVGFTYYVSSRLILEKSIAVTIVISVLIGVAVFMVVGGGRASALLPLMTCVFFLVWSKRISIVKTTVLMLCFFFLIVMTTMIRYGISVSGVDDSVIGALLYKLQGSFSPADSVGVLVEKYSSYERYPQAAINNFMYFIPRFLWTGKPLILENASGYFTKEILNYPVDLTISVTLVGEFMIYGGIAAVCLGGVFTALYVRFFDFIYCSARKDPLFRLWYMVSFISFFALLREGVAVAFRDVFLATVLMFFVVALFHFGKIIRKVFSGAEIRRRIQLLG